MIDTDKYGMTNEELLERYSNLSVDDYKELLAEVKRLREEKEMLLEELKNDDTGIKAIDGLLKAVGDRNKQVKRLRKLVDEHNEESWYQREWVEKLFENMGRSSADVAQAVENFQNYRGD